MKTSVGTYHWSLSGGKLRRQDRVRLIGQALLTRMAGLSTQARNRLGFTDTKLQRIDLGAIRIPDSAVAQRASAHAKALSEPWLYNHCVRTYLWGAMLAQSDRIAFDEELFYVASILHDLGLTDTHRCQGQSCACFAVVGARAAQTFASNMGWERERTQRLAEAISLHLNVRVGLDHGPEAHLLQAGAGLDLIGTRVHEIGQANVRAVLLAHPRIGVQDAFVTTMKEQARVQPDSRAAFLVRLGFIGLLRSGPLQ